MVGILTIGVAYSAAPTIDTPLRTGVAAPADAAVVIGVEDYAFLPDVPYAAADALAMYNALVYTRGIPAERVERLVNGNREQILGAVERARTLAAGGQVWITFAGHGAAAPDDGSLLLVGDDAKADPAVFVARSVSLGEILEAAGPRPVLILDTCHAGRGADGSDLVSGARFAVPTEVLEPPGSTRVWTAARPSQVSEGYAAASHGLFTYFTAGALRGWADGELDGVPDGTVTLTEAHAFVTRAIATVHPAGQTPTFSGDDLDWVSADTLEAPPVLSELPRVGGDGSSGVAPIPIPRPASLSTRRHGIAYPVTWQGKGLLADAAGRTISFSELERATKGYSDTDAAARRYESAVKVRSTGAIATVGSLGYGLLIGYLAATQEADYTIYGVTVVAVGGLGLGAWGVGGAMVPKARTRYLDAANAHLAAP